MNTWRMDRLTLQGFKSFAERTVLDFLDPITGIIGPNGSGKSNLVEAIRFVTGARAQELRGQELKALLFQGGEGEPPAGFAEVRLELSRGRERLLVERRIEGEPLPGQRPPHEPQGPGPPPLGHGARRSFSPTWRRRRASSR